MIQSGAVYLLPPDAPVQGVVLLRPFVICLRCSSPGRPAICPRMIRSEGWGILMLIPPRMIQSGTVVLWMVQARGPPTCRFSLPRMFQSGASGHPLSRMTQSWGWGVTHHSCCSPDVPALGVPPAVPQLTQHWRRLFLLALPRMAFSGSPRLPLTLLSWASFSFSLDVGRRLLLTVSSSTGIWPPFLV